MRRIVLWLAATVTVVVLLFGYHTSTNRTDPTTAAPPVSTGAGSGSGGSGTAGSGSAGSGSGGSGSGGSGTGGSGTGKSGPSSKAYTGSVAQTQWGPVQVKITVADGKITKVDVVQQPDGNHRDAEINSYALPILVQETITAQSADIDMVSGATVTSDGYVRSLQSALDEAGI